MKINAINAYREPTVNNSIVINRSRIISEPDISVSRDAISKMVEDTESLFTRKERDFFVKMFPDNQEQIERHQLFNRNGKLQDQQIFKGIIFDELA